ncbi:response regulator [Thalassovita aquimarina]|uniref:Response regulator n=1 Tax=Thalassovita aquimarina TaxID=2785917 RepID=A0ABS5HPB3_9RHOB|nr:response regulator [Thalassovita aquimarina]MBR9650796.1 response regulator [Thalassovita aquimarina]
MARILVIDDEDDVCFTVSHMLERHDHDVVVARNGGEGIAKQRATPFDVVITDLVMPDKEGIETIREIVQEFPDLPIVAMSGGGRNATTSYLDVAGFMGAAATLPKPFLEADLLAAVETAIRAKAS